MKKQTEKKEKTNRQNKTTTDVVAGHRIFKTKINISIRRLLVLKLKVKHVLRDVFHLRCSFYISNFENVTIVEHCFRK